MRTTMMVVLAACAILMQGCIVISSVKDSNGHKGKTDLDTSKMVGESPVAATLKAISTMQSEETKYPTLVALAKSPMDEEDYVALIKAIETVKDEDSRKSLLITAINTRAESKTEAQKPSIDCK